MEQKVLRVSTWVLVGAFILRILSTGIMGKMLDIAISPSNVSWMLFFQTGRFVRPASIHFTPEQTQPPEPSAPHVQTAPPAPTQPPEPTLPVFSADDAQNIQITSSFSYTADLPGLLTQPLSWDLTGDTPTVLILHAHGSESFAPTGEYQEISPYHTLDTEHNMVSVGTYVAEILTSEGIGVIHDTALHDSPSYNASYTNSRESAKDYLEQYPSIRLVLDLHRDSIEDEHGNQIVQTVFSGDTKLAPLMLVVGTDYGGLTHSQWRENLALALKLQTQMEAICPGICRNINLRSQRFNQDLSSGALLVEVGSSGNTRQEALLAAEVLAEGIISLARGSAVS